MNDEDRKRWIDYGVDAALAVLRGRSGHVKRRLVAVLAERAEAEADGDSRIIELRAQAMALDEATDEIAGLFSPAPD